MTFPTQIFSPACALVVLDVGPWYVLCATCVWYLVPYRTVPCTWYLGIWAFGGAFAMPGCKMFCRFAK